MTVSALLAASDEDRPAGARAALFERLEEAVGRMDVVDAHCHPISEKDAVTTVTDFLGRISLSGFADGTIDPHFANTVFVRFLTKEMAGFLGCEPRLEAVIEARNERGRDYAGYIRALFEDADIADVLLDTGYVDGLDADGVATFADAIAPTRARYLARVETITDELFALDLPYDELRDRFVQRVRAALDGTGNLGQRSVGMKSYLLPDIGVIRPEYDDSRAAASWAVLRAASGPERDRAALLARGQVLRERMLTLAMEECLARDMPMQFHAGDGEPPEVILRNQHPYYLEEVIRLEKDGELRMPKVVPVHAGYPLVGQAAWLSHIYRNAYFELSTMTPFIHQRLAERYQEVMEVAPLSKILYGSDAFHLPELYWIGARWGKRYLAQALGALVVGGALGEDEAVEAAGMILHRNTREAYNLTD